MAVEGDENSSFFHGILNKDRNTRNIRGVKINGVWVENLEKVKREFYEHFRKRFSCPDPSFVRLQMSFPNTLSMDQQRDKECEVSNAKIKKAVWDCGMDKAPGPDDFSFGFYRRFWYLIEKDVCDAVRVIRAIHGVDERVDMIFRPGKRSCLLNIIHEVKILSDKGIDLMKSMSIKLGDGEECKSISVALKLGQLNLSGSFRRTPRGGVGQHQFVEMSELVKSISLVPRSDRLRWYLDSSGDFTVASVRKQIDNSWLPRYDRKTRWVKYVPIETNILAWKVMSDALPTRKFIVLFFDGGMFPWACLIRTVDGSAG
nr:RNA-directed DNA polymerase, eukaryota, reverse transcriptase zinc-binding domain protein [Tanacetum cinerariifolium]